MAIPRPMPVQNSKHLNKKNKNILQTLNPKCIQTSFVPGPQEKKVCFKQKTPSEALKLTYKAQLSLKYTQIRNLQNRESKTKNLLSPKSCLIHCFYPRWVPCFSFFFFLFLSPKFERKFITIPNNNNDN